MTDIARKPQWLKTAIAADGQYAETGRTLRQHHLHTICESGRCPNRAECWARGTATFLIGGDICTRSCKFCNTRTGKPLPLDPDEPQHVAESVDMMQLKHAVITSVDRDDLPDLGARHWAETIRAVRRQNPGTTVEVLVPDFQGREELLAIVAEAKPHIMGHNMETVRRLTPQVRSAADYDRSLEVIRWIAHSQALPKSGLMLGLGETTEEVIELMADLRDAGCQVLTIGQYLQPTHAHLPVSAYITPEQFSVYRHQALNMGFKQVESGPLVRSSYYAEKARSLLRP